VVNNSAGVAETNPATVAFQLTAPIGTIGGIVVLSDGSIDVADFAAQSIFKIMNPGTPSMAITTLINGPAIGVTALCCTISGMANPPSQQPNTTNLFLTLNGVSSPLPSRLQLAVPEMNTVTTIVTGTAAAASVTAAGNASGGTTTYFGNFSPTIPANSLVTITGFANVANNGQFVVVSCTGAQLVVNNPNGVAETPTNPGSAIFTLVFANDVAWYTAQ